MARGDGFSTSAGICRRRAHKANPTPRQRRSQRCRVRSSEGAAAPAQELEEPTCIRRAERASLALGQSGIGGCLGVSRSRINCARWRRRRASTGPAVVSSTATFSSILGSATASGNSGRSRYGEFFIPVSCDWLAWWAAPSIGESVRTASMLRTYDTMPRRPGQSAAPATGKAARLTASP